MKKCTEDQDITTAFNFFNPIRKKRIKAKPTDIGEFLNKGGEIKKIPTPDIKPEINSRYRRRDLDYLGISNSRFSQKFRDKNEKN